MTLADAQKDYCLLEWCDALSLLLCQHENQPEARAVEISQGPDKRDYQLVQSADQTLTVRPWPFENPGFELSFETRLIPQLAFKNSAEFLSAFLEAEVTEKRWTFKRD